MEKLKTLLKKLVDNSKKLFSKNPVTIITIFAATIFAVIALEADIDIRTVENIMTFAAILAVEAFFVEAIFKKKSNIIAGYIVSVVIAAVFTKLVYAPISDVRSW